jgi:predicted P-loop ATPase
MKAEEIPPAEWTDEDDLRATEWLQLEGISVRSEITGQAVEVVAREASFHPVRSYLNGLKWDGTRRLDGWLHRYFGADDSTYTTEVGSRFMISAVARVIEPGCKADCCLILEGPQGMKKSTALRVLAGPWFTDEIADLGSKDSAMQTMGVWIIEIAELDAMSGPSMSKVKAFLSRSEDRFRPPYGKRVIRSKRQCVFAGTVNHNTYLNDETGGRRFWPVKCDAPSIDIEGLIGVRDQLWAEAMHEYQHGKPWWLDTPELNRLAAEQQADRYEEDAWDELIVTFVAGKPSVSVQEILTFLGKERQNWTHQDRCRIGRCLRAHGWIQHNLGSRAARERRYLPPE